MTTFPLIRIKRTNEHIMSDVFKVLILYHLPIWFENPIKILGFLLLVGAGVLIDIIFGIIRYKRVWCCVSGAVTAAMISLLTVGTPLWGQLLGVAVGLIIGKHVFGGTGRNILNPAMVGLFSVMFLFDISNPFFEPTLVLLPAILFGLFFLESRPFAGIGFIAGMLISLYVFQDLTWMNIISYGVFFWGCLVMTDPVTVTKNRAAGLAAGFLSGLAALYFTQRPEAIVICILFINLFSSLLEDIPMRKPLIQKAKRKIPKVVDYRDCNKKLIDLTLPTQDLVIPEQDILHFSVEELLNQIQKKEVFGMGGAAFPSYRKIMSVLNSTEKNKHLIINGVECDPGLIHDAWLLRNYPAEIVKGIEILNRCMNFEPVHLAVKDREGLEYPNSIQLHQIIDRYPMGAERILIQEVLGRQLTGDQIPAMHGILVLNAQTVYSIYQAVALNQEITTRFLTVADLKRKTAQVVKVTLGTRLYDVMEAVYPKEAHVYTGPIFVGGGIMQAYAANEDTVIDKTTNFIATGNFPRYKESPQCSKCGNCSTNCPSGLRVDIVADLVDRGKIMETKKYHVDECISCGSCSYCCPAGRNLAARMKAAKEALK